MKKISIFAPVLNEEENILIFYQSLVRELKKNNINDYEIILTDNNSSDNTENIIHEICKKDKQIKYLRFKKNIGYDLSLLLGMFHCTGDYAISTHSDLQDPARYIINLIERCEKNKDLVGHLLAPDFFDVKNQPVAKLLITKGVLAREGTQTLVGEFTIKGVSQIKKFDVNVEPINGGFNVSSYFDFERTKFGIEYKSKSVDALLDTFIYDEIGLKFQLTAMN